MPDFEGVSGSGRRSTCRFDGERDRHGRPTLHRRVFALIAGLCLSGSIVVATGSIARADEAPASAGPRSLAVSVPPDPVSFDANDIATVHIRVSDPGETDVPVRFAQRAMVLADDGKVQTRN